MSNEKNNQMSEASGKMTSANKKVLKRVGATIIDISKGLADAENRDGATKALPGDPFERLMGKGEIIEPPFDMLTLATLPEHNTEMGQCIEAMEVNIESFGHRFVPRIKAERDKEIPGAEEIIGQTYEDIKGEITFDKFSDTIGSVQLQDKIRFSTMVPSPFLAKEGVHPHLYRLFHQLNPQA